LVHRAPADHLFTAGRQAGVTARVITVNRNRPAGPARAGAVCIESPDLVARPASLTRLVRAPGVAGLSGRPRGMSHQQSQQNRYLAEASMYQGEHLQVAAPFAGVLRDMGPPACSRRSRASRWPWSTRPAGIP
jgi:hypothetical protein